MFLGFAVALASVLAGSTPGAAPDDSAAVVRRIAATAQLAAQEYRLGVKDGRVVLRPEVEEAALFLTEARRTAGSLPADAAGLATAELDRLLALVSAVGNPDSVDAGVRRLTRELSRRLGVSLDVMPTRAPDPARGAAIYREQCASCHGLAGRGDGPAAAGLDPPPADLTDAAALRGTSPLDYYHRITIGVAGTAMPAFESRLGPDDRWAAAVYATLLRLPPARGEVPPALRTFAATARMSDSAIAAAVAPGMDPGSDEALARIAAVRSHLPNAEDAGPVFAQVRAGVDSAIALARAGRADAAGIAALDAYMTFEQVEARVRAKNASVAAALETGFGELRARLAGPAPADELGSLRARLLGDLERAERSLGEELSGVNLFLQSLVILLREGLEAILVIGALMAFLVRTGASHRRRDIHLGVGAAVAVSLLTAILLETIFHLTPARREALEGITMMAATAMLFYVSYWLLSKMEVAKWNSFVKAQMQEALSDGSTLALASVAFLAVYREGFETVLFYKALVVAGGGSDGLLPIVGGIGVGAAILVAVYVAINRFGVRLPLKPFFAVTSAFLYYMAFVFAGKGIAELQEGGLVGTTFVSWAPRAPALGIYPTVESLALQGVLIALAVLALGWIFVVEPRRARRRVAVGPSAGSSAAPAPVEERRPDRVAIEA
ncbi:MAG TPA: FTR1 family protein [Gemmatimonadales bacterium]|nr:FTR1 family protein [Gemmatimonadales bacterium]